MHANIKPVSLRPLVAHDAGALFSLLADGDVATFISTIPHPYRPEHAEAFIDSRSRDSDRIVARGIVVAGSDDIVGVCSLNLLDAHTANVAFWLGVRFRGMGHATHAVLAMLDLAGTIGIRTVIASHVQENHHSAQVLLRCGFVPAHQDERAFHGRHAVFINYSRTLVAS